MKVKILREEGYDLALRGMAYSFKDRALDPDEWWEGQRERALDRAPLLAPKGGGHNKFLRQMFLWIDIEAPRAFWSEFDTYKVGTVAQSESTMHTLSKRPPTEDDFEARTHPMIINAFQHVWAEAKGDITELKMNLPEGFLQRRLWTGNYENLRCILAQRENHRLHQWSVFRDEISRQAAHPEFLPHST